MVGVEWLLSPSAIGEVMNGRIAEAIELVEKKEITHDLVKKMIMEKGLSEEDTKKLIVELLEFTLKVAEMREAQRYYHRNKMLMGRQVAYKNMITKEYYVDIFLKQFKAQ